ncbi:MAG: DUF3440 domain-containing protein [Prevotellaceae bacterium]|jgi:predicted phosphoadenosine phosphosulfate sulfurtransferase|nr:DUF3440 domain-containing protein [Prevotellaceae bacterium]
MEKIQQFQQLEAIASEKFKKRGMRCKFWTKGETYIKKFKVSEEFWGKHGGVLEDDVIDEIQKNTNAKIEIKDVSSYNTAKRTIKFLEYPDELNIEEFQAVPSYKRMVVCILKNDHLCKYMGFTMTKEETERRKRILEKYKNTL